MRPYTFSNTFTFCTDIPLAVHFNCAEKNPTEIEIEISLLTKSGPQEGIYKKQLWLIHNNNTNNNYDWYTTTIQITIMIDTQQQYK